MDGFKMSVFNLRWWLGDPNNGYASMRKLRMAMWIGITPLVLYATIKGTMDVASAVAFLSMGTVDGTVYAVKSPTKDKNGK